MTTSRAEKATVYMFLVPALLMLALFTLVPAIWAGYVSMTNAALAGPNALNVRFIGFRNYVKLFHDAQFYHSLLLSLMYAGGTIIGQFCIGMTAALLLTGQRLKAKGLLLGVMVLPMVIPPLIQALMWSSMLASKDFGTLNRILALFGSNPVAWLQQLPLPSIILVNFWNNSGFAMILFLSGLETISRDVVEAAEIDGANGWRLLRYIKLPLIRYFVMLWLLMNTLGCLNTFDLVYALTRGGPANATEIMGIYVYNRGFQFLELGYGSAAALVMLCVSLALGLTYLRLMRVEI